MCGTPAPVCQLSRAAFHGIRQLSPDVEEGEVLVLVGPPGCRKTTALRMIAGLETITTGHLQTGGEMINDVAEKERDVARVFPELRALPAQESEAALGAS